MDPKGRNYVTLNVQVVNDVSGSAGEKFISFTIKVVEMSVKELQPFLPEVTRSRQRSQKSL